MLLTRNKTRTAGYNARKIKLVNPNMELKILSPRLFAKFFGTISPKMIIAIDATPIPIEKPTPLEKPRYVKNSPAIFVDNAAVNTSVKLFQLKW